MERLSINVRLEFWAPSQFPILGRPFFLLTQLLPPGCSNEETSREGCVLFLTLTHSHILPPRIHPPFHCLLLFLNWVNSFKHLPTHPPIHPFTHNTYLPTKPIYPLLYLSIHSFIHLSSHPFIKPHAYPFISLLTQS